jgi:methyltransferase (TIGR00027 family)
VRTQFFDNAVLDAISARIPQVVILGAGYDGRALRFRTPGVRFFEVDHPATQRDKRERLVAVGAPVEDIAFVAADFTRRGLATALQIGGHDRSQASLFVCEGVLRYLPAEWARALLRTAADAAAPTSRFAISISTREFSAGDATWSTDRERQRQLAAIGEPVLTVPDRATALQWLHDAGWSAITVEEVASSAPGTRPGRLLVTARR